MTIRYQSFPKTEPAPKHAEEIVQIFRKHSNKIDTEIRDEGLKSNEVLAILRKDLQAIGFDVENKRNPINRPVFYGLDNKPAVRYRVDGYHPSWKYGIEIEAGRAWMSNAVYRDLIQAMVMVEVNTLFLVVGNVYRYKVKEKMAENKDFDLTLNLADALFSHTRITMPYKLVLIGY